MSNLKGLTQPQIIMKISQERLEVIKADLGEACSLSIFNATMFRKIEVAIHMLEDAQRQLELEN